MSVRHILRRGWGDSFQNYVAKPHKGKFVTGNIWEVTEHELEFIRYWELVEYGWYEEVDVAVKIDDGALQSVKTVCLRQGQEIDRLAHPELYDPWLQPPER